MRDRTAGLQRQPRRALTQLVAVLLRGSHTTDTVPLPRTKSWLGGVRQTQPASDRRVLAMPGSAEILQPVNPDDLRDHRQRADELKDLAQPPPEEHRMP